MAFYRERNLRQFGKEVTGDGIGTGGGFIIGGLVGRQVENMIVKTPVDETSPLTSKLFAWAVNNGSKAVLYVLAKQYDAQTEVTKAATSALAGSVVYDTVLRLANRGYNPADVALGGYRILGAGAASPAKVQKLVQENHVLRTELNKALQKLAGGTAPVIKVSPLGQGVRSEVVQSPEERQKKYGSMPIVDTPYAEERQRKYGSMTSSENNAYGFISEIQSSGIANTYGML